jgi:hypothetical protein
MIFFRHLLTAALLVQFSALPLPKEEAAAPVALNRPSPPASPEDQEYIPWLDDHRLSWEDFQGEPRKNTDAVASTSTSLGIAYQVKNSTLSYQITCKFSRIKSWGLVKTDYILAHEQGHFDITELFARKLHQELQDYRFNKRTFRKDVNDIYQRIVKEKEAFQAAYDGQTDHSRNRRQQMQWLEKIGKLLEETADYSAYP